jgi:phage-related holin
MIDLTKISQSIGLENAALTVPVATVGGSLAAFFSAPVLVYLLLFVLIDFITGIWKAWLIKRIASNRFGDVFTRAVMYGIIFVLLHGIALSFPPVAFLESIVMVGYMIKEALSVLENLKAIQLMTGKGPDLDFAMEKLGIDTRRIMDEIQHAYVEKAKMDITSQLIPPMGLTPAQSPPGSLSIGVALELPAGGLLVGETPVPVAKPPDFDRQGG